MQITSCEHCGEDVVYDADDACCPTYCAACQRAENLYELHLDDLADKEF